MFNSLVKDLEKSRAESFNAAKAIDECANAGWRVVGGRGKVAAFIDDQRSSFQFYSTKK